MKLNDWTMIILTAAFFVFSKMASGSIAGIIAISTGAIIFSMWIVACLIVSEIKQARKQDAKLFSMSVRENQND